MLRHPLKAGDADLRALCICLPAASDPRQAAMRTTSSQTQRCTPVRGFCVICSRLTRVDSVL